MSSDPARRMQILSSEQAGLLAARSLAWNETFSRAAMYLTTLSGSSPSPCHCPGHEVRQGVDLFALVILPVVLFIGVATMIRRVRRTITTRSASWASTGSGRPTSSLSRSSSATS